MSRSKDEKAGISCSVHEDLRGGAAFTTRAAGGAAKSLRRGDGDGGIGEGDKARVGGAGGAVRAGGGGAAGALGGEGAAGRMTVAAWSECGREGGRDGGMGRDGGEGGDDRGGGKRAAGREEERAMEDELFLALDAHVRAQTNMTILRHNRTNVGVGAAGSLAVDDEECCVCITAKVCVVIGRRGEGRGGRRTGGGCLCLFVFVCVCWKLCLEVACIVRCGMFTHTHTHAHTHTHTHASYSLSSLHDMQYHTHGC
jgi:hypothetical protein